MYWSGFPHGIRLRQLALHTPGFGSREKTGGH
jgi:hypothetical protein